MSKPFLSYDQQLDKLINDKKLIIPDQNKAMSILKNVGYFSLIGGYKDPFINPMTRIYKNNVSIDDIYALYYFDQILRELIFKYLCQIERKIRQLISYNFCHFYGEQQSAYLNPANYNNSKKNSNALNRLISILKYQAYHNTEHLYLVHHRQAHHNVPLWVLVNALSYGQISKFYALLSSQLQSNISKEFPKINERELEQYLKILTLFRNVCAHNERLFSFRTQIDFPDTALHNKLNIRKKGTQYLQGKRDLFGLVIAFRYLLPPQSFLDFKRALIKAIRHCSKQSSQIDTATLLMMMGFPDNWETITYYHI